MEYFEEEDKNEDEVSLLCTYIMIIQKYKVNQHVLQCIVIYFLLVFCMYFTYILHNMFHEMKKMKCFFLIVKKFISPCALMNYILNYYYSSIDFIALIFSIKHTWEEAKDVEDDGTTVRFQIIFLNFNQQATIYGDTFIRKLS